MGKTPHLHAGLAVAKWVLGGLLGSRGDLKFAVLISANAEWKAIKPLFPGARIETSPYGEYFYTDIQRDRILFFQGGWGKACGGVEGRVKRFDVVAPDRVVIYDIREAMGDSREAVDHYSTALTLPSRMPVKVIRTGSAIW